MCNLLTEICLSSLLHLYEDHSADLLGSLRNAISECMHMTSIENSQSRKSHPCNQSKWPASIEMEGDGVAGTTGAADAMDGPGVARTAGGTDGVGMAGAGTASATDRVGMTGTAGAADLPNVTLSQ